jgi:hypothetical protein
MKFYYTYVVDFVTYQSKRYYFGAPFLGINSKEMLAVEEKFKAKEKIEIYYNPVKPSVSTVKRGVNSLLLIAMIASFFFTFILIVFLLRNLL